MSEPATAITFVDSARAVHGTARSGLTLLFDGRSADSHPDGPVVSGDASGWHASLAGQLELDFAPVGAVSELSGARVHLCTVTGDAAGSRIEGLGAVTETLTPPRERLDRGEGTGLGRPWLVIVLNDDHNTFQGVAATLSAVIPGVSYEDGMRLANRIHNSGQAVVWSGLREQAELYWEQLRERGLTMAPLEQG